MMGPMANDEETPKRASHDAASGSTSDGLYHDDASRDGRTLLAAIMFTDIAGYSRLMEEDEQRTIDVLRDHNEIVLPVIEAADGEVIDAIGDGLLVLFPSVRDAITCAGTIHDAIEAHNRSAEVGHSFLLRIGIHLGEVRREGDRIFGNGVNMAARVQPFADPGGICISEDVYNQIANKLPSRAESIGRKQLRNISRSVELYRLVTGHEVPEDTGPSSPVAPPSEPGPGSEFDSIKERILSEKERIASRRGDNSDGSFESRIESKVFSVVERVMDTAITKWDSMPEEKKEKAIASIRKEIVIGSDHPHRDREKKEKSEGNVGDGLQKLGFGTVALAGFGYGFFFAGLGWMIWPFVILGIFPFLSGISSLVKYASRRRQLARTRPRTLEKTVLKVAADNGGELSVVQLAAAAELPLDEARAVLESMTERGYVTQHVTEDGLVNYRFPLLDR